MDLKAELKDTVRCALQEDVGSGDLTAALVPESQQVEAHVLARESAVVCGIDWFNEVFAQLDDNIHIEWQVKDGDYVGPKTMLCRLRGPAQRILTGERTALNFLQTLSGTATQTRRYVERVKGTGAKVLDTRKTLPGLRNAQKYAVTCGGGVNHRQGLYDAILIKENHIEAIGSITEAVKTAKAQSEDVKIIVEVENLNQVSEALEAGANQLLIDNLPTHILARAVQMGNQYRRMHRDRTVHLEASGNIDLNNIRDIADTGVDFISIGGLTKHVTAIDLSMRFGAEEA